MKLVLRNHTQYSWSFYLLIFYSACVALQKLIFSTKAASLFYVIFTTLMLVFTAIFTIHQSIDVTPTASPFEDVPSALQNSTMLDQLNKFFIDVFHV